ncbi:MAG TPA: metallophosphoesterase [Oscillatoriaceae cyanobacterium]
MKRWMTAILGLLCLSGCGTSNGAQLLSSFEAVAPTNVRAMGQVPSFAPSITADAHAGSFGLAPAGPLHFYFCSDTHDGFSLFRKMVGQANEARPAFVLDGGDLTEQGMASETRLLNSTIAGLQVPFVALPGNHDYKHDNIKAFEQEFGNTPRTFDSAGVHFILINDADQQLSEDTFKFLESDLPKYPNTPIVVAMHVPVEWKSTPAALEMLHKLLPGTIAEPKIENPQQVQRFTDLMQRYHVALVLAGHTHFPGHYEAEGVPYEVAGAAGGKLINVGASHEYLDVTIEDGKPSIKHVALDQPTNNILEVAENMLEYFLMQQREEQNGVAAS